MEHKIFELNRYWSEMEQTGQPPSVTPKISKSFQPFQTDERSQRSAFPSRSQSQRGPKSASLPASRNTSFNRPEGQPRQRARKGPITKHGTRRRTTDGSQKLPAPEQHDQRDSAARSNRIENGHDGAHYPGQTAPEIVVSQHSQPHVSQMYYPNSEDFNQHIPQSSYSYQVPDQSYSDNSRSLEDQILPDTYHTSHSQPQPVDEQMQPEVYQPVQSQNEQSMETYPSQGQPQLDTSFHSQSPIIPPDVSNRELQIEQPTYTAKHKPEISQYSGSSSKFIPDTLPMTKSFPDVTRPPPPKVDIMPKVHFPRRADSPPRNFRDLFMKFQTGDTEAPKESKEKMEVQKELSQVLQTRATFLDEDERRQQGHDLGEDRDLGLKGQIEEVNKY